MKEMCVIQNSGCLFLSDSMGFTHKEHTSTVTDSAHVLSGWPKTNSHSDWA
jgi:hypothetical protein